MNDGRFNQFEQLAERHSWKPEWEFDAPVGKHCCDLRHSSELDELSAATWTLLNPADGGDPLYYCNGCAERLNEGERDDPR